MRLQNGVEITVMTELDPVSFLDNFNEIRDTLWNTVESELTHEIPAEESKGNTLNFEGGCREQWMVITDRITGFTKKYHICDAEVDANGIITLTLNRGNGSSDVIKFPYATEYQKYQNFKYFVEVAPTKEELKDNL